MSVADEEKAIGKRPQNETTTTTVSPMGITTSDVLGKIGNSKAGEQGENRESSGSTAKSKNAETETSKLNRPHIVAGDTKEAIIPKKEHHTPKAVKVSGDVTQLESYNETSAAHSPGTNGSASQPIPKECLYYLEKTTTTTTTQKPNCVNVESTGSAGEKLVNTAEIRSSTEAPKDSQQTITGTQEKNEGSTSEYSTSVPVVQDKSMSFSKPATSELTNTETTLKSDLRVTSDNPSITTTIVPSSAGVTLTSENSSEESTTQKSINLENEPTEKTATKYFSASESERRSTSPGEESFTKTTTIFQKTSATLFPTTQGRLVDNTETVTPNILVSPEAVKNTGPAETHSESTIGPLISTELSTTSYVREPITETNSASTANKLEPFLTAGNTYLKLTTMAYTTEGLSQNENHREPENLLPTMKTISVGTEERKESTTPFDRKEDLSSEVTGNKHENGFTNSPRQETKESAWDGTTAQGEVARTKPITNTASKPPDLSAFTAPSQPTQKEVIVTQEVTTTLASENASRERITATTESITGSGPTSVYDESGKKKIQTTSSGDTNLKTSTLSSVTIAGEPQSLSTEKTRVESTFYSTTGETITSLVTERPEIEHTVPKSTEDLTDEYPEVTSSTEPTSSGEVTSVNEQVAKTGLSEITAIQPGYSSPPQRMETMPNDKEENVEKTHEYTLSTYPASSSESSAENDRTKSVSEKSTTLPTSDRPAGTDEQAVFSSGSEGSTSPSVYSPSLPTENPETTFYRQPSETVGELVGDGTRNSEVENTTRKEGLSGGEETIPDRTTLVSEKEETKVQEVSTYSTATGSPLAEITRHPEVTSKMRTEESYTVRRDEGTEGEGTVESLEYSRGSTTASATHHETQVMDKQQNTTGELSTPEKLPEQKGLVTAGSVLEQDKMTTLSATTETSVIEKTLEAQATRGGVTDELLTPEQTFTTLFGQTSENLKSETREATPLPASKTVSITEKGEVAGNTVETTQHGAEKTTPSQTIEKVATPTTEVPEIAIGTSQFGTEMTPKQTFGVSATVKPAASETTTESSQFKTSETTVESSHPEAENTKLPEILEEMTATTKLEASGTSVESSQPEAKKITSSQVSEFSGTTELETSGTTVGIHHPEAEEKTLPRVPEVSMTVTPEATETPVGTSQPEAEKTTPPQLPELSVTVTPEVPESTVRTSSPAAPETSIGISQTESEETTPLQFTEISITAKSEVSEATVRTSAPATPETTTGISQPELEETTSPLLSKLSVTVTPEVPETTIGTSSPAAPETTVEISKPEAEETTPPQFTDIPVTAKSEVPENTVGTSSSAALETTIGITEPEAEKTTLPQFSEVPVTGKSAVPESTVGISQPEVEKTIPLDVFKEASTTTSPEAPDIIVRTSENQVEETTLSPTSEKTSVTEEAAGPDTTVKLETEELFASGSQSPFGVSSTGSTEEPGKLITATQPASSVNIKSTVPTVKTIPTYDERSGAHETSLPGRITEDQQSQRTDSRSTVPATETLFVPIDSEKSPDSGYKPDQLPGTSKTSGNCSTPTEGASERSTAPVPVATVPSIQSNTSTTGITRGVEQEVTLPNKNTEGTTLEVCTINLVLCNKTS